MATLYNNSGGSLTREDRASNETPLPIEETKKKKRMYIRPLFSRGRTKGPYCARLSFTLASSRDNNALSFPWRAAARLYSRLLTSVSGNKRFILSLLSSPSPSRNPIGEGSCMFVGHRLSGWPRIDACHSRCFLCRQFRDVPLFSAGARLKIRSPAENDKKPILQHYRSPSIGLNLARATTSPQIILFSPPLPPTPTPL